jgi:hypothetical protein
MRCSHFRDGAYPNSGLRCKSDRAVARPCCHLQWRITSLVACEPRSLGSNCVFFKKNKVTRVAQRYAACQKKSGITRCARPSALIPFFSGTPLRVKQLGNAEGQVKYCRSTFFGHATPDRAGARPYRAQCRVTRCDMGLPATPLIPFRVFSRVSRAMKMILLSHDARAGRPCHRHGKRIRPPKRLLPRVPLPVQRFA